jgi:hypothetical protein
MMITKRVIKKRPTTAKKRPVKKVSRSARKYTTKDAHRLSTNTPLITGEQIYFTPEKANRWLRERNPTNRTMLMGRVRAMAKDMREGRWLETGQPIMLDNKGMLITGQKRLMAVVLSGISQTFFVTTGTPMERANLVDRGQAQSARDLASRLTGRAHSPQEQMLVRGMYALNGQLRPTADDIADLLVQHNDILALAVQEMQRISKTKALYMVAAAICHQLTVEPDDVELFGKVEIFAKMLAMELAPTEPEEIWNKGAPFKKAMVKALEVVLR